MSIESAKAFIEQMKTDEEFNEKVKNVKNKEDGWKILKAEGFEFTEQELKEAQKNTELSDDELDAAAGGYFCGCMFADVMSSCPDKGNNSCWYDYR